MSKVNAPRPSLDEHLQPGLSETPDYRAWKEVKIRRALEAAEEHPKQRIPAREMWKKFGLAR